MYIYIHRVSSYLVVFALRRPADLASPLLYNWWNFTRYTCDVSDGRISCSFSRSSYSSYSRRTENEKFSSCSSFFFPLFCFYRTHKRALFVLSSSKFDQPYIKTRFVQPLIRSALFRRIHRGMRHVLRNGYGSM